MMPSPGPFASWRRSLAQLGLLAGLCLVFANDIESPVDAAPMPCQKEGGCFFKKPLFVFLLDNSSDMNQLIDANQTHWHAAVAAITQAIDHDNGYIAEHFILALIRFGHDPDPKVAGSKIAADTSGLVDGQRLDVPWYDKNAFNKPYIECSNGDAILAALAEAGEPSEGLKTGIGRWIKGALDFTAAQIAAAKADHPQDMGKRPVAVMLLTSGPWTNPQGNQDLAPAPENPKLAAGPLWMQQGIPTYVVAFGDAVNAQWADELALAGGTTTAIDAATPKALVDAVQTVITDIQTDVVTATCAPGTPRIMVLLDASSSTLNINGGTQHAPPGFGGWDQLRDALAGDNSIFDVVLTDTLTVADSVQFGLAVFGHNSPEEQKLVVQYDACNKENIAWALDPNSSCEAPGCVDPYAKPPIQWSFKDGSQIDPPGFATTTLSHMPKCDFNANAPKACLGSGTFTHLGLDLVRTNLLAYKAACSQPDHPFPCTDATDFRTILITDGKYNSTDAQVQTQLEALFTAGAITHVIGFGDAIDVQQLNKMADWGSGNLLDPHLAKNQDQLEMALVTIIEDLSIDPCCALVDCVGPQDPNSDSEPDPVPQNTSSTTDTTTGSTSVDTTTTTADPTRTSLESSTGDPVVTTADSSTTSTATTTTPTTPSPTTTATTEATPTDSNESTPPPSPTTTSATTGPGESAIPDRGCVCATTSTSPPLTALLSLALLALTRRRR